MPEQQSAYFDHAATSPMPEAVIAAYSAALRTVGNPASQHTAGQNARDVLESAREKIAREFAVTPAEIIFTSGGTEAINLALKGIFWERNRVAKRPLIFAAEGEHHATIDALNWLNEYQSARVVWLPLTETGVLNPETLEQAFAQYDPQSVALFSVIWANNEIGSVQPVQELIAIAKKYGVPTHLDAVAALGQFPLQDSGAAAVSISAHKIGGPVSSGALILARDTKLQSLIHGGSQQRARSGTQDAAAATAFASALELANAGLRDKQERLFDLQQRLITGILAIDPTAVLRGAVPVAPIELSADPQLAVYPPRIYANVHFTFPGCQGDSLLFLLDMAGVAVSTGSACTAGVVEVSHVMTAIGLDDETAAGALRFTFSATTTDAEVQLLLDALPAALAAARKAGFTLG